MSVRERVISFTSSHLAKGTLLGPGNLRYRYQPSNDRKFIITAISSEYWIDYVAAPTVDLNFETMLYSNSLTQGVDSFKDYDQFSTAGVVIDPSSKIILDHTRILVDTSALTNQGIIREVKPQIRNLFVPFSDSYPLLETFIWSGSVAAELSQCYRIYTLSVMEVTDETEFQNMLR